MARFLYDKLNPVLSRATDPGTSGAEDRQYVYDLTGVDILLAKDGEGVLALVSSQNPGELVRVEQELRVVLGEPDAPVEITPRDISLVPDPDLFLWLLFKTTGDGQLAADLILDVIRTLQSRDAQERKTRMLDWVDAVRAEAAIRARDPQSAFGPAKLVMRDLTLGLEIDWQLNIDGSFSVFVSTSEYEQPPLLNSPAGRLRVVHDLVRVVMPKLYTAHRSDQGWHTGGREAFRDLAIQSVIALLAGHLECPECGHVF